MEGTNLFDIETLQKGNIKLTLKEVSKSLRNKGYDPIKQITGYIMSGDPGYISNYENARDKIETIDRVALVAYLLESELKCDLSD